MNIKRRIFFGIAAIFILNSFLVIGYIKFYLLDHLNIKYIEISEKYETALKDVIPRIENSNLDNIAVTLDEIAAEYEATVSLKNIDNKYIYNKNKVNTQLASYTATSMVKIEDKPYLVSILGSDSIFNYSVLVAFLIGELVLMYFTVTLGMIIVNREVLNPMLNLRSDMRNYRFGVRPKKKKVETEFDELQNSYVALVDNLEEEKQKQNRIIASISHDIKTPLTAVIGYSDRLESANLNEVTRIKYIQKIHNKALNMKEIIEEFDDYLSCNIKYTLKKEKIKVKDFLKDIKNNYKDELEEKNIEFKIETNCSKNTLTMDIAKIRRIFSNIINNSVRHFGGKKGKITINCFKKGKQFEFCISDNGSGVKEEHLNKIFEPLFTTDQSRKISGLGLSICKEIIEVHDGEIYAENNQDGGLSIYFTIENKFKKE